jgi:dipeptidyl aminopeptidase/acylaminoacyl peptidase
MRRTLAILAMLAAASGCTGSDAGPDEAGAPPADVSTGSTSGGPVSSESSAPTATPEPAEDPLPEAHGPVSLPALMRQPPAGGKPRILRTEYETDAYTRYDVTYRSDGLTVSGVLIRPKGKGAFPGIVLNHGYIEPSVYATGQGLAREQDALARAGYVVLHTDYRGHAASDPVPQLDRETRLGYTRDAVNAVAALTKLPYVDPSRLAMLGRSMGGGVTMNALVTQPGLVDAAVIYDSVSSRFLDNLDHFTRPSRPGAVTALFDRYGTPAEAPRFYRELSPRTYFDRITEPLLVHHGRADRTCPPAWARTTQRLMGAAGVDSRLSWWPGEDHAFYARWQDAMDQTLRFLGRRLA